MMAADRPPRAAVRAAVREALADLDPGARVVVALSGGADSLALLSATVAVSAGRGLVCTTVVVDHGLQPASAEVARRAADQARALGCSDVEVVRVQVATGPGVGGPEAAARAARYAALEQAAAGVVPSQGSSDGSSDGTAQRQPAAAAILLGHTRDDQAETVLLGLARGSGTRSLAGMAPRTGLYRRPLLGLPRAVVAAAAAEAAEHDPRLVPWADPHNDDPGFTRVRVRTSVLPVLEGELGPGVVEALARTADLARADADALDAWADRVWSSCQGAEHQRPGPPGLLEGGQRPASADQAGAGGPGTVLGRLPLAALVGPHPEPAPAAAEPLPAAISSRLVRRLLISAGCPPDALTAGHVRAVMALIGPAGPRAEVALPRGLRARREGGALVVRA